MKKILFLLLFSFFLSCSKKENFIYYTYNNVTITRLDKGNEMILYFGKQTSLKDLPKSYLKAKYNGFDGLISCYLIFNDSANVEVVTVEGIFDTIKTGNKLRLVKFNNNLDFIKWNDKIKNNYKNIIELSDVVKNEIRRNEKNNSKVKTSYPKE